MTVVSNNHRTVSQNELTVLLSTVRVCSRVCLQFYTALRQIYDFNDDDEIDRTDLDELVNRVTGFRMKTEDVDGIVDEILKECDMDENG